MVIHVRVSHIAEVAVVLAFYQTRHGSDGIVMVVRVQNMQDLGLESLIGYGPSVKIK